LVIT